MYQKRILKEIYTIKHFKPEDNIHNIQIETYISIHDIDVSFDYDNNNGNIVRYYLNCRFTRDYPFKKPIIKFILKNEFTDMIIHPNIYPDGRICLSCLEKWAPSNDIINIIDKLCNILDVPDTKYTCNYSLL